MMGKMIYEKKPWALPRTIVEDPEGTFTGFYGETSTNPQGSFEDAYKAVQALLQADIEKHRHDGRSWK